MYAYKTSQVVSFKRRKIMWITTNPSHEVFRTSVADPDLLIKGGEGGRSYINTYVVVNFLFQLIFSFPLFWGMVMYANEFKTKEKQKLTEIKN